jgi:hypothetical protein
MSLQCFCIFSSGLLFASIIQIFSRNVDSVVAHIGF